MSDPCKTECDRCGVDVRDRLKDRLYPHNFPDELGGTVHMDLCWDCDWEVSNGHDPFDDIGDIWLDRWEDNYAADPVNVPPPPTGE